MNTAPITIEQKINAPAAAVWTAITNPTKMKEWYFDVPAFKAEEGNEFSFSGGPSSEKQYLHLCTVKEVVPGRKLAHTWRYDGYAGDTLVTWELSENGDGTKVRLTHEGLESFGTDNPDFARINFEAGWTEIVGKMLPEYLYRKQ